MRVDFGLRQRQARAGRIAANSASTASRERLEPLLVHEDLDAGLVFVVAPAFEIVDAQDRVAIARAGRARAGSRASSCRRTACGRGRRRHRRRSRVARARCARSAGRCHAPGSRRDHAGRR